MSVFYQTVEHERLGARQHFLSEKQVDGSRYNTIQLFDSII